MFSDINIFISLLNFKEFEKRVCLILTFVLHKFWTIINSITRKTTFFIYINLHFPTYFSQNVHLTCVFLTLYSLLSVKTNAIKLCNASVTGLIYAYKTFNIPDTFPFKWGILTFVLQKLLTTFK